MKVVGETKLLYYTMNMLVIDILCD